MRIMAYAPFGADGIIIRVEADIRRGIPGVDITGLAEGAVREARERVRAAFRNSGLQFPQDRLLINLAPAGVRKEGASLDLPIALAVIAASEGISGDGEIMVMGELELSGRVRPVRGVLAAMASGMEAGISEFIVPEENAAEAAILKGNYAAAATLADAVHALKVRSESGVLPALGHHADNDGEADSSAAAVFRGDFADVRGQARYKRALEIAAAGGHNLLVFGPPGAGKTMLARRLPSIMAPLSPAEAVEVTRLYSLAGRLNAAAPEAAPALISHPPFRSPHHSASAEGILGGGKGLKPGEISLAHHGVLFLDEAPEFRKDVLQALREPLEDRVVTISRADGPARLPAAFQLILAANPCPCGRLGIRSGEECGCLCSAEEINRYWRKFGGALLDRIELRVAVNAPSAEDLTSDPAEPSAAIAARVRMAVDTQRRRFAPYPGLRRNALIPPGLIEILCPLTDEARDAYRLAAVKLGVSGRAYHGILRTARTIADLEGGEVIDTLHILEALQHRRQGEDPYEVLNV